MIKQIADLIDEDIRTRTHLIIEHCLLFEGEDLIDVLSAHFESLPEVLAKAGVEIDNLRMIGRGDKGTAFSDGNVIVKVTEDAREAMASANMLGKKLNGVNNIHFVGKFPKEIPYQEEGDEEPIDTRYYVIVQDQLETGLSTREGKIADLVGDFLLDYYDKIKWPFDSEKMVQNVYRYGYQKHKENFMSPSASTMIKALLDAAMGLNSVGIKFFDINSGNVGKNTKGNYTIFDLGISDAPHLDVPLIR